MTKNQWRYRTIEIEVWRAEDVAIVDRRLNFLGKRGWELVSVLPSSRLAFVRQFYFRKKKR
jgi:hypothetical protein